MAFGQQINELAGAYQWCALLIRQHAVGKPQTQELSIFFNRWHIVCRQESGCSPYGTLKKLMMQISRFEESQQ